MEKLLTPPAQARLDSLNDPLPAAGDEPTPPPAHRSWQERDRDRILYCSAFARLASITQVTPAEGGYTFHNRLTHSLKVGQVARRNAERLKRLAAAGDITGAAATLVEEGLNADSAEAAGLGHDLGHPPFGHIAEEELQECARAHDGDFEGNAQSFRILTRLATRNGRPGLELTRQTLDATLKYPWLRDAEHPKKSVKWGAYVTDSRAFDFAREHLDHEERSIEAELMDWADDVTYAIHDVDDFFRAGLVPLDRFNDPRENEQRVFEDLLIEARDAAPARWPGTYEPGELVAAVSDVLGFNGPSEPYSHTLGRRGEMRIFASDWIGRYLDAFELADDPASGKIKLTIDDEAVKQVSALKMLTVAYVVRRPSLAVVQHGQRRVIRELYEWYLNATEDKEELRLLPPGARENLVDDANEGARSRVVVDLISGLSENAAVELHGRLSGRGPAVVLDAMARRA